MAKKIKCPKGYDDQIIDGECYGIEESKDIIDKECHTNCEFFYPTQCPYGYRMTIKDGMECAGLPIKQSMKDECVNCEHRNNLTLDRFECPKGYVDAFKTGHNCFGVIPKRKIEEICLTCHYLG